MVEGLNGRIRVESSPGKGASFIIELPVAGPVGQPTGG
jgi:signal transduction histidine kinase